MSAINDPVGDYITRIRNAQSARHRHVDVPASKLKRAMTQILLEKGYVVHGIKRRTSLFNTDRIDHLYEDPQVRNRHFILHYGDLTDSGP